MLKQKIKIYFLVTVLALSSFGCGSSGGGVEQKQIVLKWWKPFDTTSDIQYLIDDYRATHPNVEIQYTKKNVENYESDLIEALASGEGPDIFSIQDSWLPKYLNKTVPAPESKFSYTQFKKDFVDVVLENFTRDQKIYGIPLSVDSMALYYNKDLLHSAGISLPPKTWSEFASVAQKMAKQDRTGYFRISGAALGTSANINRAQDILYLFMLQRRATPYSKDKTAPMFARDILIGNQSVAAGSEALAFYTSFANPRSSNYMWTTASDYSTDAFVNGRAGFVFGYSYLRSTIESKAPNLNYEVAPVPQPNLEDTSVNFANFWGEVVSKQGNNSDAAWDFLNFVSQKKQLEKYASNKKVGSPRRDVIQTQVDDPIIGVFANASLTAKAFYRPDQAKLDKIILNAIDAVNFRGKEPESALQDAESQAATIKSEGF